jgi:hypothetical protein
MAQAVSHQRPSREAVLEQPLLVVVFRRDVIEAGVAHQRIRLGQALHGLADPALKLLRLAAPLRQQAVDAAVVEALVGGFFAHALAGHVQLLPDRDAQAAHQRQKRPDVVVVARHDRGIRLGVGQRLVQLGTEVGETLV